MKFTSVLFLTATCISAHAATLLTDDFTYADGSLVPNGGWANHSGTAGDLLVESGAVVVQHGTPSEDANIGFAAQTAGVLTANFDIVVNDDTSIGGTDSEYFAHFFTSGSFNFRSRLDVVPATVATFDYTLGISSGGGAAEAALPTDFNFGETVSVSLSFDLDTGTGSLTVGGDTIIGSVGDTGQSMNAFGLRQSDSSNNESITIDNLEISHQIPEPSSALLGALSLLGLLRRRR